MPPEAFIVHPFTAGLDTQAAATFVAPGGLTIAENIEYVLHFAPGQTPRVSLRKRLGTARYNAATTGATDVFTSVADYWRHGASLSPTQKFVACVADKIVKDDGDGIWDELLGTGFGSNTALTDITIAEGLAIFSNNANQAPRSWDQTTFQALAGTPPNFSASVYHLRRLFGIGIPATPSQCTYSAAGGVTTWSGADSGNFIFDEDDGDRLIGVSEPFFKRLYFFKGPHKGSIHTISGTTMATFTKDKILTGLPCQGNGGIVTTPNDIYWVSNVGIHSLSATQKYGDTEAAFLSYPIQNQFRALNQSRLQYAVGFYHPDRNIVGWTFSTGSNSSNNQVFCYNYATGFWATWTLGGFGPSTVAILKTPSTGKPRLYFGAYDGFLRSGDQTTLADDNADTGYAARVRTPTHLRLSDSATELHEKSFMGIVSIVKPMGNYTAALQIGVDTRIQSDTVSLLAGSGDLIGSTFVIGTSLIGASNATTIVPTPIGELGRSIYAQWTQSGVNQDFELYGYAIVYQPGESLSFEVT